MILTKTVFAILAILPAALAAPAEALGEVSEANLFVRHNQCRPGEEYCGWGDRGRGCKCKRKGQQYDADLGRCAYPRKPDNGCGRGEQLYCARSQDDWCEYNKRDDRCHNDGKSKVFCCKKRDLPRRLKEECPRKPTCKGDKVYSWDTNSCVCPKDLYDLGNDKCGYKPFPRPTCHKGQSPWCAKDKNNYVQYNANHDYCKDDGYHTCFCDKDPKKYCKDNYRD